MYFIEYANITTFNPAYIQNGILTICIILSIPISQAIFTIQYPIPPTPSKAPRNPTIMQKPAKPYLLNNKKAHAAK